MRFYVIFAIIHFCAIWSAANQIPFQNGNSIDSNLGRQHADEGRTIDLSNQGLRTLDGISLKGPPLKTLDVSHNKITEIPKNFFINPPNLSTIVLNIDISYNRLNKIESHYFHGAKSVTKLDLSHNEIKRIDMDSFEHLIDLDFVDLSHNQIFEFNFKFGNVKQLNVLHLEHNPVQNFGFYGSEYYVKQIFYPWDQISTMVLPEGNEFNVIVNSPDFEGIIQTSKNKFDLYCDESSFIHITEFKAERGTSENLLKILKCFSSTQRTYLQKLDLSGNFIGNVDANTFRQFSQLQYLDLSDTKLMNFDFSSIKTNDKLGHLDISLNKLKSVINPWMLQSLKLNSFRAAGNHLENTREILDNLNEHIQELDLSDSDVALTSTTLNRFKSLQVLTLRNSRLSIGSFDPFKDNTALNVLDISMNNFPKVNFAVLSATLKKLNTFRCANCQIDNVSSLMKLLGDNLSELDLSGNAKVGNTPDSFTRFEHLQKLNLGNMGLLHFDFWQLPKTITELHLEWNGLTRIDNFDSSRITDELHVNISKNRFPCLYLRQLLAIKRHWNIIGNAWDQKHGIDCQSIDVSNSDLKTLVGILMCGPPLKNFNASHNQITEIPDKFFTNPEGMSTIVMNIDMSYNRLHKIESHTFDGVKNLMTLDLSHNSIESIDKDSFEHLIDLDFVELSHNQIFEFNFKFSDIKPLKILHFEHNNVEFFHDFGFDNNVKQIYCSWKKVSDMLLPKGIQFNVVTDSQLEGIVQTSEHKYDLYCNAKSFESIWRFRAERGSSDNLLEILKCFPTTVDTRLKTLDLSGNIIKNDGVNKLKRFVSMQILGLTETGLSKFDFSFLPKSTKEIHLDGNDLTKIDHFDSKNFEGGMNIERNLFQCNYLKQLMSSSERHWYFLGDPWNQKRGVDCSWKGSVDLSNLNLQTLKGIILSQKLTTFNVSHNQIKDIPNEFFINSKSQSTIVINIDMSYNRLRKIELNTFDGAKQKMSLNLSHNEIRFIHEHTFNHLDDLDVVDLSHNQISEFNFKFGNEKQLNVLHLEHNPVQNFGLYGSEYYVKQIFYPWDQISTMVLPEGNDFNVIVNSPDFEGIIQTSENKYDFHCNGKSFKAIWSFKAERNIDGNWFEILKCFPTKLSLLQILDLSGNSIEDLDKISFTRFSSLWLLNLNETGLLNFDFAHLPQHIKELHLERNNLTEIENFDSTKFEGIVNLSKNQFTCNYVDLLVESLGRKNIVDDPWDQQNVQYDICKSNGSHFLATIWLIIASSIVIGLGATA